MTDRNNLLIKEVITLFTDTTNTLKKSKKTNNNIELEVSIQKINRDIFISLYNKLIKSADFKVKSISRSLDTLVENLYNDPNPATYRRQMEFTTTGKSEEEYMKKTKIMKKPIMIEDFLNYKIKLSMEERVNKFSVPVNSLLRFKIRTSFIHKSYPNWRFDLTMVKSGLLGELGEQLQKYKKEILTPEFTYDNIFDIIPLHEITSWEVEIEWIGDNSVFPAMEDFKIVSTLFGLIEDSNMNKMKFQQYMYEIAKEIETNPNRLKYYKTEWGLKQLLNQVIGLTKQTYKSIYPPIGYYATEKTDGYRCIVYVKENKLALLYKQNVFEVSFDGHKLGIDKVLKNENTTYITDNTNDSEISIIDAEIVGADNEININSNFSVKIFDVIMFRDEPVGEMTGRQRIGMLKNICDYLNKILNKFTFKEFKLITEENLNTIFKEIYGKEENKDREGLIIMAGTSSYSKTKNYKWKNFEHNTIDFLAKKVPPYIVGNYPFIKKNPSNELYVLFVGITGGMKHYMGLNNLSFYNTIFSRDMYNQSYQPIQFSPSSFPLAYLFEYETEKVETKKGKGKVDMKLATSSSSAATSATSASLDNTIIELRLEHPIDATNDKIDYSKALPWKLEKVREDRKPTNDYFGNNFEIAEITFQNYFSPFTLEDLSQPDFGYFNEKKSMLYEASNKIKRMVGTEIISKYAENANWVLDLASGRGADLQRFQIANVKHLLMIDIDTDAISELIARKYQTFSSDKIIVKGKTFSSNNISMSINTLIMDLNQSYVESNKIINEIIGKDIGKSNPELMNGEQKPVKGKKLIDEKVVDFIIFNFAFHYFCNTEQQLENIMKLIVSQISIGGIICMTVMNGKKIFDLLKNIPKGGEYIFKEQPIEEKVVVKKGRGKAKKEIVEEPVEPEPEQFIKYGIKKKYIGEQFMGFNQTISVKMPFSTEYYDEPLVDIDNLITKFKSCGFELINQYSFSDCIPTFYKTYKLLSLDDEDKAFIDIYHAIIFKRSSAPDYLRSK